MRKIPAISACSILRLAHHGSLPPVSPRNPLSASMPFLPDSRSRHLHEGRRRPSSGLLIQAFFLLPEEKLSPETSGTYPEFLQYKDPRQRGHWESTHSQIIFLLLGKPLEQSDDLIFFFNLFYKKKKKRCFCSKSKQGSISSVFFCFLGFLCSCYIFRLNIASLSTMSSLLPLSSFIALLKEPWNLPFL